MNKTEILEKSELFLWRGWLVQFSVLSLLFVILYYPILSYLVYNWSIDENYSHGYIIPFISAYLIWERKSDLILLKPAPNLSGLFILFFGLFILILGLVGAELFLMRFSILIVIGGIVLFLIGWKHLKILSLPIGYLIFMIPLPAIVFNAIAFPLQLFAARIATDFMQLLGIPVLREGNLIYLAHTTLAVTEACSGIRSLITMLALATIYAYFTQPKLWKQVVLISSAVPIAILANMARVSGTGLLAHYVGVAAAEGFYHIFEGWFLFILAFIMLLLTGVMLNTLFKDRKFK